MDKVHSTHSDRCKAAAYNRVNKLYKQYRLYAIPRACINHTEGGQNQCLDHFQLLIYLESLKDMCYEKLLQADLCVVVTPEHIGKSTSLRIKQAKELHKPVFVWLHETLIPMEEWETTYKNK